MHSAFIVLIIFGSLLVVLLIAKRKTIFSKPQGEGYTIPEEDAGEAAKRETFLQESSGPLMARTSGVGRATQGFRGTREKKKK